MEKMETHECKALKIIESLDSINEIMELKWHEIVQQFNLSLEQFHLLIELDELELNVSNETQLPTVGEIANNMGNAPNTLSERIKRLEKKGLVEKIKDNNDLRVSRVALTNEGRRLIESIKNQVGKNLLNDVLKKMDEKSLDNLLKCLDQLLNHLSNRKN
jgi:MarR family transcriptional regulator, organic hydroperoxide resistance regulator